MDYQFKWLLSVILMAFLCCCSSVATTVSLAAQPLLPSAGNKLSTAEGSALHDQVKLLEKQLTALTMRRREDYQLLEDHLKKFLVESARQFSDIDIKTELQELK